MKTSSNARRDKATNEFIKGIHEWNGLAFTGNDAPAEYTHKSGWNARDAEVKALKEENQRLMAEIETIKNGAKETFEHWSEEAVRLENKIADMQEPAKFEPGSTITEKDLKP